MIITEAGNQASVRSLVYINAFQPDLGETAGAPQRKTPPATTSIGPVGGGFVAIKQQAFHEDFAADVPESVINPELERFMSRRAKSETIELTGSHVIFL